MHTTSPPAAPTRPETGVWLRFYDPTGERFGIPTYPYRWAPDGLLTRRQLTALGMRPGPQPVAAQILWWNGRRVAYLYRLDLALPKRTPTPAQRVALAKARKARRTCSTCGQVKPYYIPTSLGECLPCAEVWT